LKGGSMFALEIILTIIILWVLIQVCMLIIQFSIRIKFNREIMVNPKYTMKLRLKFLFPMAVWMSRYRSNPKRSERNPGWSRDRIIRHDFWFGIIAYFLCTFFIVINIISYFVFGATIIATPTYAGSTQRTLSIIAGIWPVAIFVYAGCVGGRRCSWDDIDD